MFVEFFYAIRGAGIPVTPTAFLRLQSALGMGMIRSLDDLYVAARCILVKSERYFDLYDQVFARHFAGGESQEPDLFAVGEAARILLEQWLKDPKAMADALGVDADALAELSPEALIQYLRDRLRDQTEEHHGGSRWIGTGGTSPVGHSGFHLGGLRVGGRSGNRSAVKVAMERRFRDYAQEGPLTRSQMGEALKRLKHMVPSGPKDRLNIEATLYETMKHGGEIEIVFDRRLKDRLKILLAVDNGGWSMESYVDVVQTLFSYAQAQFKDLRVLYFHNTIYDHLWEDPQRYRRPVRVADLARCDPETRFIAVGDASMAPYELMASDGSIYVEERSGQPSLEQLRLIAKTFPHAVWLNPKPEADWPYTRTIGSIRNIFPMFELSLDGLEKAVRFMMGRR